MSYRKRRGLRDAKRACLLLLFGRCALPHIRRKCFSILARTQLPRTNANFISLPPLSLPSRCCLRKNQLYPAISIGLHAKMSTLYCYHRHIIRDIGTSHFPVGGCGIGHTFALTAAAKPIKRQIHTYTRAISKELLHVVWSPGRGAPRDSHKNRQSIMHGKFVSQTWIFTFPIVRCLSAPRNSLHFSIKLLHSFNIVLTSYWFAKQRVYV